MSEERRLVTILFADVVGSTALGENLDPEDVRALLGRLFAIAREAVERHGGRVEKFIGDAIMAVFGLPIAHDDDAARALSAALELRDRVRADPALADRLAIRLGVNSGEVIATRDQEAQEFLVTGDPVNTSARLQQAAEPWMILVGERTARAAGDRFSFGPSIAVEAKGKANPVSALPLEAAVDAGSRARHRGRIVGREADLSQLQLTARRAFDERRPFVVSIVAPAGVGKSRLLEEFLDHLDPSILVATAQCLPYGQRLTYWPMRAILLSIIGLGDASTPDVIRPALGAWLREAGDLEADRTAELLAATIGAGESESADRIALFAAWRRFVEFAADKSPLVLVIEDLHWSSDSLLDLVESMLQPRADLPILMIALARPELLDRRPSWGGGRRNSVSIALDPLPSQAVAELVADLLPDATQEIVDAVVERAEGNPFYAGEIVRSLIDRLGAEPDPVSVPAAIASLPDTVQATVLARLDALDPTSRRVVQLGAVMGRTFEPRALPVLEPSVTEEQVAAAVEALLDRDLIRSTGRGQQTFRHILIREVAYGTLPRSERARLHAAAGSWLESEAVATGREDELAELVAFHFREASVLATLLAEAPLPDLPDRAVRWLRLAAEVANSGAASVEAAHHLEAAVELAPKEALPDLYERLGVVWIGGDQAVEAFEKASALGRELGLGAAQQLATLAQEMIVRARWAGSIGSQLSEAVRRTRLDEINGLVDVVTDKRARALGALAVGFGAGIGDQPKPEDVAAAAEASARALVLARELDDPDLISACLDAVGAVAMANNRYEESREVAQERLALGDQISTSERLDAAVVSTWAFTILGRLPEAEAAAAQAKAGLVSGQAPSWAAGASSWRTTALFHLGRWDEAIPEAGRMERALAESEIRAPWYALNGILSAWSIERARGDAVEADRWRVAANRIFDGSDPGIRTQRLRALVDGKLGSLEHDFIDDFLTFTGRLDHVAFILAALADRRLGTETSGLDNMIAYADERSILLVSSMARRLRGLRRHDETDLRDALAAFERMEARPHVARAKSEIGLLIGDAVLVEAAIGELEAIGDLEHATRIVAEQRAAKTATAR
jgi:class 3 adenylate cyclase/tetratricopeptide (TPR) repeat protein